MSKLGERLKVRSLVFVASESLPFFWPMRNFVHHNPLHGLEEFSFREAVRLGKKYFHGKPFLKREDYVNLLKEGRIKEEIFKEELKNFFKNENVAKGFFEFLITNPEISPESVDYRGKGVLKNVIKNELNEEKIKEKLLRILNNEETFSEFLDKLYGTGLTEEINEKIIKFCASFLDEGQAVWELPYREKGLFKAWQSLIGYSPTFETSEDALIYALRELKIPEELYEEKLTLELSKLHGWTSFLKWRSSNKFYYWQQKYPADLVDYLAVRFLTYIQIAQSKGLPYTYENLKGLIEKKTAEVFLRRELNTGRIIPPLVEEVEEVLNYSNPETYLNYYLERKAEYLSNKWEGFLTKLKSIGKINLDIKDLYFLYKKFEEEEGFIWLKALERSYEHKLLKGIKKNLDKSKGGEVQALFCIDVRSERLRRHLEKLNDRYKTYGIAGFFGIPISFIELEKGHETYLCPVLIKPKNVVLELMDKKVEPEIEEFHKIYEKILKDLKNNVLTPYITVEAIGFLFGFDMIGKTFFPLEYAKFKERFFPKKKSRELLISKLSREDAIRIIETLYHELIAFALEKELGLKKFPSYLLERLRNVALEEEEGKDIPKMLGITEEEFKNFVEKLRSVYKVERGYMQLYLEKLAKVGFSLHEKVFYIEKALKSIGLTENFGKLVLVVGHGSTSDNNPYEAALDCGACGGENGLVNARVFAAMANDKEVRRLLKEKGIDIPEDTYFVPALHDTTTDEIEFYDTDILPEERIKLLEEVKEDFKTAGRRTALERSKTMPLGNCKTEEEAERFAKTNSVDWTQVRPEWGLSGNYAFVIGRRELTEGLNLEGRVFLHSYDYKKDPKGLLLESILAGPMVVGQWINMEHFFSASDNEHYGSGSKVYHNVVGRIGVMTGNFSDLRTGLPSQTVLLMGRAFHEPIRLIVVVEAPLKMVELTLKGVQSVRQLVAKEWVNFIVFDPQERKFFKYMEGSWKEVIV